MKGNKMNLLSQGLALQAASIGEYVRDVEPNERLFDLFQEAVDNNCQIWVNAKTKQARICRDCPEGWKPVTGKVQ